MAIGNVRRKLARTEGLRSPGIAHFARTKRHRTNADLLHTGPPKPLSNFLAVILLLKRVGEGGQ